MTIRLLLVGGASIVGQGIRLTIADSSDLVVVGEIDGFNGQVAGLVNETKPDVVFDYATMAHGVAPMPGALAELAAHAEPRVVLMLARDQWTQLGGAIRAGITGFVCEDDEPADLIGAIRATMAFGAWLSAALTPHLLDHYRTGTVDRTPPAPDIVVLSRREREVIELIAKGRSNMEMAGQLGIAESTVKTHVSRILHKLALRDRTQLAHFAYENELV